MDLRRLFHCKQDEISHVFRLSQLRQFVFVVIAAHPCVHRPGLDEGGLHTIRSTLGVGHPCESGDPKLGSPVGPIPGARVLAGERGDVDDMPMSLLTHVTKNGLRAEKDRFDL